MQLSNTGTVEHLPSEAGTLRDAQEGVGLSRCLCKIELQWWVLEFGQSGNEHPQTLHSV